MWLPSVMDPDHNGTDRKAKRPEAGDGVNINMEVGRGK